MKLSDYAKSKGISYQTAWRMWKRSELKATQLPTGTVIVDVQKAVEGVVIYARVSSTENKTNLDSQAERLVRYCEAKGYQIKKVVKEVGSGVNDHRKKLVALLNEDDHKIIVVEHKDRLIPILCNNALKKSCSFEPLRLCVSLTARILSAVSWRNGITRVGFNYLKVLVNKQGKDIGVVNHAEEETEDIMQDFISIITSFCAKIYGLRRRKRKTECIVKCLESECDYLSDI